MKVNVIGYSLSVRKGDIDEAGSIRRAEIEIDMNKIDNDDLKGELNNKLIGHLKSADFFDVAKFETARFRSKSIKKLDGSFVFDRTDYGIRYGSGQFFDNLGDKLIHDKIQVSFNLVTR